MTTAPNAVSPIHEKAMPVMPMTPEDVARWLGGNSVADALEMRKPVPDKGFDWCCGCRQRLFD